MNKVLLTRNREDAGTIAVLVVGNLCDSFHVHGIPPFCPLERKPLAGLCADDRYLGQLGWTEELV